LTSGLNYGSLCEWSSGETGRGVGEGVQKRAGRQRKCAGNRKKILNRGNEPKNVFKAKELAFLGAKNELVFQCPKTQSKRKIGANKYDSETGNWKMEAGNAHLGRYRTVRDSSSNGTVPRSAVCGKTSPCWINCEVVRETD
jgi:hypothetical protein